MLKYLFSGLFFFAMGSASAAPDNPAAAEDTAHKLAASLRPQHGTITLPGAIATVNLPTTFNYLSPADTSHLLEAWGNPPKADTLGMIVPAGVDPLGTGAWAVLVTYDNHGHVKDDDADSINYAALLDQIRIAALVNNEERKKQGYQGMTLAGWAETPHYDKALHKLYWAKELVSDVSGTHSLNYDVRILGRNGVLVMNAVADMSQLGQIKTEMQEVTAFTNFTYGNRYNDFDEKTDKVAEYGVAALIAGGVAGKLGLFGKLIALLLAFKKLIVVGFATTGSAIVRRFKRRPKAAPVNADRIATDANGAATANVDLSK